MKCKEGQICNLCKKYKTFPNMTGFVKVPITYFGIMAIHGKLKFGQWKLPKKAAKVRHFWFHFKHGIRGLVATLW